MPETLSNAQAGFKDIRNKRCNAEPPTSADCQRASNYSVLAKIYDRVVAAPVFPLLAGSFLETVKRNNVQFTTVADLGCGTGTFTRLLARQGYYVTGIDQSAEMLEIARQKQARLPVEVLNRLHYCEQDIRKLNLKNAVDMITCQFNTLNYQTNPEKLSTVVYRCRYNLAERGYFLFDFITGAGATAMSENKKINHGSFSSLWRTRTYPDKQLSKVWIGILEKNSKVPKQKEYHLQRWFSMKKMCEILASHGFEVLDQFDLEKFKKADERSYWVQILARRA